MNFKPTLLASAIFATMFLVVGCGGGDGGSSSNDNNDNGGSSGDNNNNGGNNGGNNNDPLADSGYVVSISSIKQELPNNLTCSKGADLSDRQKEVCNLRIYHVMLESFQNGDDSNNYTSGYGASNHKGDLKGLKGAVDYIAGLNMNAVLTTPFMQSCDGSNCDKLDSSGYFVNNYAKVDPHFGTDEDVQALADALHSRNMYFFGDIAMGHFKKKGLATTFAGSTNELATTSTCLSLGGTYNDTPENGCTKFSDSTPFFVDYMDEFTTRWKLDGWRFDQGYQIPVADQSEIQNVIRNAAEKNGLLGLSFAEIWGGNSQIKDYALANGVDSAFAFQTRYAIVKTFATQEWAEQISDAKSNHSGNTLLNEFKDEQKIFKISGKDEVYPISFITNHDLVRFTNLLERAEAYGQIQKGMKIERTKAALGYLASLSGPIANYYGEEIGQKTEGYPAKPTSTGDNHCLTSTNPWICDDNASRTNGKISGFNTDESNISSYFASLMKLREEVKALPFGRTDLLNSDERSLVELKSYAENGSVVSALIYGVNVSDTDTVVLEIDPSGINTSYFGSDDTLNDPVTGKIYERSYAQKKVLDADGNVVLNSDGEPKLEDDTSSPFVFRITLKPLDTVYLVKTGTISGNKI